MSFFFKLIKTSTIFVLCNALSACQTDEKTSFTMSPEDDCKFRYGYEWINNKCLSEEEACREKGHRWDGSTCSAPPSRENCKDPDVWYENECWKEKSDIETCKNIAKICSKKDPDFGKVAVVRSSFRACLAKFHPDKNRLTEKTEKAEKEKLFRSASHCSELLICIAEGGQWNSSQCDKN